jgi:hypothetical protein
MQMQICRDDEDVRDWRFQPLAIRLLPANHLICNLRKGKEKERKIHKQSNGL